MIVLRTVAVLHYKDAVRVDHRGQPMGDDEHCPIRKCLSQFLLDQVVGRQVNVGGCFVEHENFAVSQDYSGKAHQLLLTHGE